MKMMMRCAPFVLALACAPGTTEEKDADTSDTTEDTDGGGNGGNGNGGVDTSDFDGKTEATGADLSCFTPASPTTAWADQGTLIGTTDLTVNIDGVAQDFEEEEPVSARSVELWFEDVVKPGEEDFKGNVDTSGDITIPDVPACQPLSWRVKETPGKEEAKDTYKAHQIYSQGVSGSLDAEFSSVSDNTYTLIPTIVGISIDASKSVIAGTLYDCSRDPDALPSDDTGKIEGGRIRLFSCPSATSAPADCTTPVTDIEIKYFIENFPDRNQPYSSADGLFGAFNVPEGTFRIEAFDSNGGSERILGSSIVSTYADSINIANVWAGYPDGVKYPAKCLAE